MLTYHVFKMGQSPLHNMNPQMLNGALWEYGRGLTMSQWVVISAALSVVHFERIAHISSLMLSVDTHFK